MLQNKDMDNVELANLLRNVACAYQIENKAENKFKIIAYERAADAIEHLSSEAKDLYDEGKLNEIPGVGESIASHISEIFSKGSSGHFIEILKSVPEAVFELLPLEGIGPKLAYRLVKEFDLKSPGAVKKLKEFAQKGEIEKLPGFGVDSQAAILKAVEDYKGPSQRHLLNYAESVAELLMKWMKEDKSVSIVDTLGSLRRRNSTVGDIDIACATSDTKKTLEHFVKYPDSKRTMEKGDSKAAIMIPGNIQVDIRVQSPKSYGSLLQHFTGSKHHNIALREYALKKGFSLSEYGIKDIKTKKQKDTSTEDEFYTYLGLSYIEPELRENSGEIDASQNHNLPKLVEISSIKGDLQVHSDFDIETSHDLGLSSYDEIVEKAEKLGYEYVAFTDHNPSRSKHTNSQILDLLKRKKDSVDKLNYSLGNRSIKVFNSLEIDMMTEGDLPVSEQALELIDFGLVSIHSNFRLNVKDMTKRVLLALNHPKVKIFAHPTGRKINEREGVELDWQKIFEFCKENHKFIEINADPMRLDLPDNLVKDAVKNGVLLTLGTDAHHIDHMDNMKYGIDVARRGWAEKQDIINTLSLEEVEKLLKS